MNRFAPTTAYLQRLLSQTSYDDVERFRALLLLERLALQPLRNWREEALYLGIKELYPKESANILIETSFCRFLPSQRTEAASRRSRFRLKQALERPLTRNREQCWRERAVWLDAGGQP